MIIHRCSFWANREFIVFWGVYLLFCFGLFLFFACNGNTFIKSQKNVVEEFRLLQTKWIKATNKIQIFSSKQRKYEMPHRNIISLALPSIVCKWISIYIKINWYEPSFVIYAQVFGQWALQMLYRLHILTFWDFVDFLSSS